MTHQNQKISSTLEGITQEVRQHLVRLAATWEELGLDEDVMNSRFSTCQDHVKALFDEMEKEENDFKQKMATKVTNLLNQLEIFNRDLDRNDSVDVSGLTILESKAKLDNSLRELKQLHGLRKEERAKLEAEELQLCTNMGRQVEEKPLEKGLSDPVMKEYKERVQKLRQDRARLQMEFQKTRREIIDLYSDLEAQPATEFQQSVTDPNTQNFPLDPDSLLKVAQLHDELQIQVKNITEEADRLRMQLAHLWDRLEVDPETRASFLENHPGISKSTRQQLQEEVARCEELKIQNLEKFTLRMRDELLELWEKCHVADDEKELFLPFQSLDFTEELLELHEAEVRRLETFFNDNRDIFDLLSSRAELWERMSQLEIAATDSNRLNNRGGQLLKEEKERKQIQKQLPKVEKEISKLIHAREVNNGEPFLINGRRASLVLQEQWEAKRHAKEAEKQCKKQAQQKQLERDAIMGTTMMVGQKRKFVPGTPDLGRKMPRITPAKAPMPTKAATTAGKVGKFARPVARPTQRKLDMHTKVKPDGHTLANESNASAISSYAAFTRHLEARATRSSAVPTSVRIQVGRAPLSPVNSTLNSFTPGSTTFSKQYLAKSAPAKPPRSLRSGQTPTGRVTATVSVRSISRPTRKTKPLPIIF